MYKKNITKYNDEMMKHNQYYWASKPEMFDALYWQQWAGIPIGIQS